MPILGREKFTHNLQFFRIFAAVRVPDQRLSSRIFRRDPVHDDALVGATGSTFESSRRPRAVLLDISAPDGDGPLAADRTSALSAA